MTPTQADEFRRRVNECRASLTALRAFVRPDPASQFVRRELTGAIDSLHSIDDMPNTQLERCTATSSSMS